jgi:tol-pal system protein YbgF
MRNVRYWSAALMLAGCFSAVAQAATLEERVARVERMVNSRALMEMLDRLDSLQQEVQQLRGQVEEQQHTITGLKERQRELYLDIDRRMSRIEREGGGAAPTADATAGTAGSSGPALTASPTAAMVTPPAAQTAKPATAATDQNRMQQEREAYQQAFDLLRELRYAQATTAFRDFLKKFPDGQYAHIAQYWLGEAAYAQRDFKQAIADYNALLANFPKSPKRAEAMLKIGYSHYELKEADQARAVLEQLVQQYPDSTEAGQARNLLKRINKNAG